MSRHHSNLKRLKLAGNLLFIAIGWTLFILNIVQYADSYIRRTDYVVAVRTDGNFSIVRKTNENQSTLFSNCTSKYSRREATNILNWFIASKTKENILFQVFYWFMLAISLIISIIPPASYLVNYLISNNYNITERYCLVNIILLIRTFFSITVFVLPSFYMNTFDFSTEICLTAYPRILSIDILVYVLVTFIGLIVFFLFNFVVNSFYEKNRFCCSIECLSYVGLCTLGLLIFAITIFSATIIAYIFITSFIETPLRLTAILVVVQFPFLIVQLLTD